jgi:putative NIF3 family GTP cyclohydrolase 1 type 2
MNIIIQNILDALTSHEVSQETFVDKLEYGNPASVVEGVAVTFLATHEVIEKANSLGVNLIITHEGIFYSHWDKRELLQSNLVYKKKFQVIEESGMAIVRYHDYIHKCLPDGIMAGLLNSLDWQAYEVESQKAASLLILPEMTMQEVILYIKKKLNIQYVRFIGDLAMTCRRIGLLVGYRGSGELVIPLFEKENLDLVIYGEGPEWETPEYIRDAVYQGKQKALIVLGHAESETPGMEYLTQKLQDKFPSIPIHFIRQKPIFQIL